MKNVKQGRLFYRALMEREVESHKLGNKQMMKIKKREVKRGKEGYDYEVWKEGVMR